MRSRLYSPWLAVVAAIAACALGILGLPAAAFAQSPAVTFTPSSGPVGTSFTITGSNWMPGGQVTSTLPYGSPGWFTGYQAPTVDANGKFSYTETVGTGPGGPTPSGTYTYTYVENYHVSSLSATQTFTVDGKAGPAKSDMPPVSEDAIQKALKCGAAAGLEKLKALGPDGKNLYDAIVLSLAERDFLKNRALLAEAAVKFGIDMAPYGACFEPIFFPDKAGGGAPPAAPTDLSVTPDPNNGTVLWLAWRDNSNDEYSFEVSNGNESRSAPASLGTGIVKYIWTGLKPGSWTCFRVRAGNGDTFSNWEPNAPPWWRCDHSSLGTAS